MRSGISSRSQVQAQIIAKKLRFFVIDAIGVAQATGMGGRINTIMQTCFFAISGVLPKDEAIEKIKESIRHTYGKRGEVVVQQNFAAVDHTLTHLYEVKYPDQVTSKIKMESPVSDEAPAFVKDVTAQIIAGDGENLPVSAFPVDGTWPTATTQWEKRNLALEIPVWDASICIQCGKCALVCPHAAIRTKVYPAASLAGAPETYKAVDYKSRDLPGMKYTVQVAPEDCTGCALCVENCPAKNKSEPKFKAINMEPQLPLRITERANFQFFLDLPELDRTIIPLNNVKNSQLLQPLFEFSGACSGCGETPYIKLVSQLFGDRAIVANATGCTSIYGGNLPTTPWAQDKNGRGPAWANSLFEDNAEFGMGFRLTVDKQNEFARELIQAHRDVLGDVLVDGLLSADQSTEKGIAEQRAPRRRTQSEARRLDRIVGRATRQHRRYAGQAQRLDHGRRRLGLRYRLRRPGSCAGIGSGRQRPGARYAGLLQHRRPGVEGDPARRWPASQPAASRSPRRTWARSR